MAQDDTKKLRLLEEKQKLTKEITELRQEIAELRRRETQSTFEQKTLKDSEIKYRNLFENSGIGMFRSKLDGSAVFDVNQKACDIFMYSREEMLGGTAFMGWADPDSRKKMQALLIATGKVIDFEAKFVTKDGSIKTCLLSAYLYEDEGILEGCLVDITKRKKLEQDKECLITYLKEALEKIKTIRGLIPICANCKSVRNDEGYWIAVESYVKKHTDADFSHGICPDCAKKLYGDFYKEEDLK